MRAVLMSIRPEHLVKILNGNKTIEVRKAVPKEYIGWIYMYCTKCKPYLYKNQDVWFLSKDNLNNQLVKYNGKVVARFWFDKYEFIEKDFILYIKNLELLDNPKELKEFKVFDKSYANSFGWVFDDREMYYPLKRAPRIWMYVEVKE